MTNTHMDLYDNDFFAWMQQQAAAIRAGDWEAIDRENLGEEIDSIVRHASGELQQHLAQLLGYLLAWVYAPEGREAHPQWYVFAVTRRFDIEIIIDVWPRLAQTVATTLPQAYAPRPRGGEQGDRPVPGYVSRDLSVDAGASAHRDVTRPEQSILWGTKLMGQVSVSITLTNVRELITSRLGSLLPEAVHTCDFEALIDTEHTPSVMPEALARRLNLAWERRETRRPDGRWGKAEAKAAKRGLWSDPYAVAPWAWRKQRRR